MERVVSHMEQVGIFPPILKTFTKSWRQSPAQDCCSVIIFSCTRPKVLKTDLDPKWKAIVAVAYYKIVGFHFLAWARHSFITRLPPFSILCSFPRMVSFWAFLPTPDHCWIISVCFRKSLSFFFFFPRHPIDLFFFFFRNEFCGEQRSHCDF